MTQVLVSIKIINTVVHNSAWLVKSYCQTSNIRRTLVGNTIVHYSNYIFILALTHGFNE